MPRKKVALEDETGDNPPVAMQLEDRQKRALNALYKAFNADAEAAPDIARRLDRLVQALVVGAIDKVKAEVILKTVTMQVDLLSPKVEGEGGGEMSESVVGDLMKKLGVGPPEPIKANAA